MHIVIIGLTYPEPASTAAGRRLMQLIDFFLEEGHRITFLTAAMPSEHSVQTLAGVAVIPVQINDESFDETIRSLKPDAVLYDRFVTEEQFGWRVSQVCPEALTLLDTEDLHFLRESRAEAFKKGQQYQLTSLPRSPLFGREMASILRCDLSLIISDFEFNLLTKHLGIHPDILTYCPMHGAAEDNLAGFDARKFFFTIGNFRHEPNWQSVLKLKALWPSIRKECPEAELHIYGAYPPPKAFQLDNPKEGFIIKGRAEQAAHLFRQYRLLLAPLPFGAGIKGKLLEAMEFGVPSVTTPIGSEGMQWGNLWNGTVATTDEEFIQAAVALYHNPQEWKLAQENGLEILTKKFGKKQWADDLRERIRDARQNLENHRLAHPLGFVLRHQTLQSTRYLSKYIQAKNSGK